ncbi:hypothetical protein PV721_15310 [Streptomyces sp. MB09-01]|uniref:hypothetical protein n=1 Tax=Streptomyces sp. MB09-01 TaxID=3028666 RepID=UPI0029B34D1E|nr:hypothetical protein [Streptomyces sp. MB09-01]MDX3535704.1 hypothetical protein [Streptomyces sp. MB09-01]
MTDRSSAERASELVDAWDEMREYVDHEPQTYERLADDGRPWTDPRPRDAWLCPRNVAGHARVVMESPRPGDTTEALWVGMHLTSARGRAAYEKWPEPWAPPLDTALCPAFVAATARDSLRRLRND